MNILTRHIRRMVRSRPRVIHDVRAAYHLWAPGYPPHAHNPLMRTEQAAVEACVPPLDGCAALDVGTGSGRYVPALACAGAHLVVGVDISWAMLTQSHVTKPRGCADALHLPFAAASFDFVLCSLVVPDVAPLQEWALEISRVLRTGGRLLYSDLHPTWAERRWHRTFRAPDGRWCVVPYHSRSVGLHRSTLEAVGFEILDVREPCLDGSSARLAPAGNSPIALVISARKTAAR